MRAQEVVRSWAKDRSAAMFGKEEKGSNFAEAAAAEGMASTRSSPAKTSSSSLRFSSSARDTRPTTPRVSPDADRTRAAAPEPKASHWKGLHARFPGSSHAERTASVRPLASKKSARPFAPE